MAQRMKIISFNICNRKGSEDKVSGKPLSSANLRVEHNVPNMSIKSVKMRMEPSVREWCLQGRVTAGFSQGATPPNTHTHTHTHKHTPHTHSCFSLCVGVECGKPTHFTVHTKGAGKAPVDVQFS